MRDPFPSNSVDQSDRRRPRRRGAMSVYMVLATPVLCLILSLAVDVGRAQSAKHELQDATDAACRAAAADLARSKSMDSAIASAQAVAALNKVDGKSFSLCASDIEFGFWNESTRTFTAGGSAVNAVRVTGRCQAARNSAVPTIFAQVAGNESVDLHATAVAAVTKEIAPFNAMGNVTFNHTGVSQGGGIWMTNSYVGADNAYSPGVATARGHLLSNGAVRYNFTTPADAGQGYDNRVSNSVKGTIYTANGADCTYQWQLNATAPGSYWIEYGGWDNPGASTLGTSGTVTYDVPAMPSSNLTPQIPSYYTPSTGSSGYSDLVVADGSTVTLPAGTYNLNSIVVSNGSTVRFDGPVTLNVAQDLTIDSAAMVPSSLDAADLRIKLCNTSAAGVNRMTIANLTQDLYADLNGPRADLAFTQGNNGKSIMGRVKANNMTINCTGTGGIYGDESLLGSFKLAK